MHTIVLKNNVKSYMTFIKYYIKNEQMTRLNEIPHPCLARRYLYIRVILNLSTYWINMFVKFCTDIFVSCGEGGERGERGEGEGTPWQK